MAKIGRPGLPSDKRQQVWEMWRTGSSLSEISRTVGSPPGSIYSILLPYGGFYQPPQRRRPGALSVTEREEISRGLARGESFRAIAERLGRAPSTISREVAKNKGVRRYRAVDADDRAWRRARRPKPCKLALHPALRDYVAARLRDDWSPEQIAATLRKAPIGCGARVAAETIYKSLFIQSRGVLPRDLQKRLRTRRPMRRSVHNTVTGQWRSQIKDAVSISQRPAEATDRMIAGHWEGDLLLGRGVTQIATVVERSTRYTVLVQVAGRDTGLAVFFADPRSPWQRGTNENTNRLLRQYFPNGVSMAGLTQDDLDAIALKLNTRPRKVLGYRTPAECLEAVLADRDRTRPVGCDTCRMADLKRSQPEPPPGMPQIPWTSGLADDLLTELAPLLAEDGIDIHALEATDLDTLQAAMSRAVERRNMALFTPVGPAREIAAATLGLVVKAILDDNTVLAATILDQVQPESPDNSVATVAGCIGMALGLLDTWMTGQIPDAPRTLSARTRLPKGHWTGERAATDVLVLAGKGRAFRSLQTLITRQGSHQLLPGSALALSAATAAWSEATGAPRDKLIRRIIK